MGRLLFPLVVVLALVHLCQASWLSAISAKLTQLFLHGNVSPGLPDLYEAGVLELQSGLEAGHFTSVHLVKAYTRRIEEVNLQGAELRAVLEINPAALFEAQALDEEREFFGKRGPLHGIPILLKDNIATISAEGMNTTAGSYTLLGSEVARDAGVVTRLRKAGAVILGKAQMSEFAFFRGKLPSGWSGRGGQCTNAYYPSADPCGSSSGSGVAASVGLAAVTLGSETDGSITCPSSYNNLAGIKPTVGLTSRAGVIPISASQDTIGPMVRSISDAAIVLSAIAGPDPADKYTLAQPTPVPDYSQALKLSSLKGVRIGVPRHVFLDPKGEDFDEGVMTAFEKALRTLRSLGADIADPADLPSADEVAASKNESLVLAVEFKATINQYYENLVSNPSGVGSLTEIIAFNDAHPELEKPPNYESQSRMIESESTSGYNTSYYEALAFNKQLGATHGIDAAMKKHNLNAIVLPASTGLTSTIAAISGYPIVTVPLGFYPESTEVKPAWPDTNFTTVWPAPGAPFGLSFIGTAWSEFDLISYAYTYEQKTKTRLQRRAYPAAIPATQLADVIG